MDELMYHKTSIRGQIPIKCQAPNIGRGGGSKSFVLIDAGSRINAGP